MARLHPSLIAYSPLDLRIVLRVVLVLLAWKFLSIDYGALPELEDGPPLITQLPSSLSPLAEAWRAFALDNAFRIHVCQIVTGLLLLVAALRPNRYVALAGLVPFVLTEWTAGLYRAPMYDVELPMTILAIAIVWPRSWRILFAPRRRVTAEATQLGLCLVTYVGVMYFLTGLSKVWVSAAWWEHVRLDLLYYAMTDWHGAVLPYWLDRVAWFLHTAYQRWTFIGPIAAGVTLAVELFWWVSIISRKGRWVLPFVMVGAHAMIFLSSGILFLSLAVTGLAIVVPWREVLTRLPWRRSESRLDDGAGGMRPKPVWATVLACLGAALLAVGPVYYDRTVVPFLNYMTFGFSYAYVEDGGRVFRLGYCNRDEGRIDPVPMNNAGFMDYQLLSGGDTWINRYVSSTGSDRDEALPPVRQFARAIRPSDGHRWLLGPVAFPTHVVVESTRVPVGWLQELYVLEGRLDWRDGRTQETWLNRGVLATAPQDDYEQDQPRCK